MKTKHHLMFLLWLIFTIQSSYAGVYYVSLSGNDGSGDGTSGRPWRTLRHAVSKVPANQGHTIKIQAGTFVESAYIKVPAGVNIEGAGIGVTILKPASNLYHKSGAWLFDKFLISFNGGSNAGQTISDLTIDGASKNLYGGIVVRDRNKVTIKKVRVQFTYLTGIWIWNTLDCRVTEVQFKDCAFGDARGASGALQISLSERLEVDHCNIDEGFGNGVDGIGGGKMYNLKFHDNRISVNPVGTWKTPNGGNAPNISVEFYNIELKGCEMYNNYFDNTLSLAMDEPKFAAVPNGQTIRVYNNVFDIMTRAGGSGYALELTLHNAEVDHNYFWGGSTSIVNWDASAQPHQMQNWKIHHNIFYGVASPYPTAIIGMVRHGINNAHIYNNTVELTGRGTVHFLEVNNGGVAKNVRIENNLIIDSNSSYQWGPNKFLSLANGASFQNSTARNNFLQKMAMNTLAGVSYGNNKSGDPTIQKSGSRPDPFYKIKSGSPLIDQGINLGSAFAGSAPDIGAYEFGSATNAPSDNDGNLVSLTAPANNAKYDAGATVSIAAKASADGKKIRRVEFYNGKTKLGQDATNPYTLKWYKVPAGTHKITAKAIDADGGAAGSKIINVAVNALPVVSFTSPGNGARITEGSKVVLRAKASDQDGSVRKVEFFRGNTKVGEDASSPYVCEMRNVKSGKARILAKVTDNSGSTVMARITLNIGARQLVKVTTNKETVRTGETVNIQASTVDEVETVQKVEFFQGTTKLGEDHTAPYNLEWKAPSSGTYNLTAKITSHAGDTVTSASVPLDVLRTLTSLDENNTVANGEETQVKIPRVFSPNGDGVNDVWEWKNLTQYEQRTLSVFDRIGNKIYETADYQNNWDGKVDGKPLPEDAYYYVVTLGNRHITGAVRIVR